MIIAVGLGTGLGVGLWALIVGLFPARPPLGVLLARATAPPQPTSTTESIEDTGWVVRVARPITTVLRALGLPNARVVRDLAVLGRSTTTHLTHQTAAALAGLLTPVALALPLALLDGTVGIAVPITAGLVLSVAGWMGPDLACRRAAARARTGFRHALGAYLDLVGITLAGGAGVEHALHHAATIGRGWAFAALRRALDTARLTRTTPWAALRQLGEDLDITELAELGASVSLAGTEGATVRASLAAKAAALRTHQLADAETDAQAATERMALPVTLLFLGYLVFIGYPALTQVLNGL